MYSVAGKVVLEIFIVIGHVISYTTHWRLPTTQSSLSRHC